MRRRIPPQRRLSGCESSLPISAQQPYRWAVKAARPMAAASAPWTSTCPVLSASVATEGGDTQRVAPWS
ncbi:hypothetical protein HZI31_22835 [Serratia fonticola]|uniref:hypothetical protein n=1 Tax=Serratia fonticola TaxID=47917 RepID=UPI0015C60772|nr:hypothetical protein [Serratia fonticola]NXZ90027.1 hypothetical protein [Serratia fonticola]NYA46122.1 hypothetical protein [Serratia fonticola]